MIYALQWFCRRESTTKGYDIGHMPMNYATSVEYEWLCWCMHAFDYGSKWCAVKTDMTQQPPLVGDPPELLRDAWLHQGLLKKIFAGNAICEIPHGHAERGNTRPRIAGKP
jgi:hypothetical protein